VVTNALEEMLIACPPFQTRHGKRPGSVVTMLLGVELGQGHRGQTGIAMERELRLRPRLTVRQAHKLFGVTEEKLDLEPCLVIAVEREGIKRDIGAKKYGLTLTAGIDEQDHTQIAFALHMVDSLMIQHQVLFTSSERRKTRQLGPGDFALRGFGPPRPGPLRTAVEIPEIGVGTQFTALM
jgi:hypothetical protein